MNRAHADANPFLSSNDNLTSLSELNTQNASQPFSYSFKNVAEKADDFSFLTRPSMGSTSQDPAGGENQSSSELSLLKQANAFLREENQKLEVQISSLKGQLAFQKERTGNSNLSPPLESELISLRKEKDLMTQRHRRQLEEFSLEIDQLRKKIIEHSRSKAVPIGELKSNLISILKQQIEDLRAENSRIQAEADSWRTQLTEFTKRARQTQAEASIPNDNLENLMVNCALRDLQLRRQTRSPKRNQEVNRKFQQNLPDSQSVELRFKNKFFVDGEKSRNAEINHRLFSSSRQS